MTYKYVVDPASNDVTGAFAGPSPEAVAEAEGRGLVVVDGPEGLDREAHKHEDGKLVARSKADVAQRRSAARSQEIRVAAAGIKQRLAGLEAAAADQANALDTSAELADLEQRYAALAAEHRDLQAVGSAPEVIS